MSKLEVCRICLNTNVKVYHYNKYHLKEYYEQVMAVKVSDRDGLPCHFCYECSAMLHKFHKFKEKCYSGLKVLRGILWKGPITLKSIADTDRKKLNLQSTIDILRVNRRVKTCNARSSKDRPVRPESPEHVVVDTQNDGIDDDDNVMDDEPELDLKVETRNDDEDIVIDHPEPEQTEAKDEVIFPEKVLIDELKTNRTNMLSKMDKMLTESNTDTAKDDTDNNTKRGKDVKGNKNKKKVDGKEKKAKQFEVKDKRYAEFDPKYWLKINFTEEEAEEEFKARGQHKRYLAAEFKCTDCLKDFSKEDMLIRHNKLRHDLSLGREECRFCHMRFKRKSLLRRHMKQHYIRYKCLRCGMVCPAESTAHSHEEFHSGVVRKCEHCGEEFKHSSTYYTHLRTHRSEHVCTLCGASFVSELGLRQHKKIKHIKSESETPKDEDTYCELCDIKFETRKAFEEHLVHSAKHVPEEMEVPMSKQTSSRKRKRLLYRERRKPTDCNICGKHFETQTACRAHHQVEHRGSSFYGPSDRHICEVCGMSLAPSSITSHMNIHTRENLFTCKTCGKQFVNRGVMWAHERTHSNEKLVACTLCDKRFKQPRSMRVHYHTFHLKEPYPKRSKKKQPGETSNMNDYARVESEEDMPLNRWILS